MNVNNYDNRNNNNVYNENNSVGSGFLPFIILEWLIGAIFGATSDSKLDRESRQRAIARGSNYYFSYKKGCDVSIATGHRCKRYWDKYCKQGSGYWKDLETGEILEYFGVHQKGYGRSWDEILGDVLDEEKK